MRGRERVLGCCAGGLLGEVGGEALVVELDRNSDGAAQRLDEALGLDRLFAAGPPQSQRRGSTCQW